MADVKLIFSKPSFRAFLTGTCEAADLVPVTKAVKEALEEGYQLLTVRQCSLALSNPC